MAGVVYDVGNADFHISARSTDLKEGRAGFSWAAFLELPAPYVCQTKVRASTSVVPAKTFSHDGFDGVWQSYQGKVSRFLRHGSGYTGNSE